MQIDMGYRESNYITSFAFFMMYYCFVLFLSHLPSMREENMEEFAEENIWKKCENVFIVRVLQEKSMFGYSL